jgi:uncharacterized protein (DUF1810 family)
VALDPDRFVSAQDRVWHEVIAELRAGRKAGHWMWFVFPQLGGLGRSETSRFFALGSLDEARAYLAHPILGPRLRECARLVLDPDAGAAEDVFGAIDALKLRSSMTLFSLAAPDDPLFTAVLGRWFAGRQDERTVALVGSGDEAG